MTCWRLLASRCNGGAVADPLADLSADLGAPLMVAEASDRARWQQPIVYAWIRGEAMLYIGSSYRGVERPMSAKHEKLGGFQAGDQLIIWACADPAPIEEALIRRWSPRYNLPNGGTPCPGCGGRWKVIERPAGRCRLCQVRAANGYPPYGAPEGERP
jgi:hypothetical protein